MAIQKTLGGDRLGGGKKMKVELKAYERSTHDLSYDWKSSMTVGTLVPFMKLVALNADTFDIDLEALIKTKPTVAPLFGFFKVQLDVFSIPLRLYNGLLHSNNIRIGMDMAQVKLPKITISGNDNEVKVANSHLMKYLGLSGIVFNDGERKINGVPLLMYYDIFKQYYSNKQETNAYVVDQISGKQELANPINYVRLSTYSNNGAPSTIPGSFNNVFSDTQTIHIGTKGSIDFTINDLVEPSNITENILINTYLWTGGNNIYMSITDLIDYQNTGTGKNYGIQIKVNDNTNTISVVWARDSASWLNLTTGANNVTPQIKPTYYTTTLGQFELATIDDVRKKILNITEKNAELSINELPYPYNMYANNAFLKQEQAGLLVRTYKSDIYNNWLSSETISGLNGISEITSITTEDGKFTIDALLLKKKVYNMLNLIAAAGGTYEDWQTARYGTDVISRAENPVYEGGCSYYLGFEEVVSTSDTNTTTAGDQPLGTLAGKGTVFNKKGGQITIKINEPSYIMGIISIVPEISYSQGNDWDLTEIDSLNDLHAPELDGIGFQDLIEENFAWWTTYIDEEGNIKKQAAGKSPAWIHYMTNVSKNYGEFADEDKAGFMVLDRKYERNGRFIQDMTTYIDPTKFNYAFADHSVEAQNFWVQIACKVIARRKMSAKLIPLM